jgi:Flp pilus assembly protein TadD
MGGSMNDAETALARASVLCDLHRYDEALALLSRLAASQPDHPQVWCLMAQAQLGRDDNREALRAAQTAIPLMPGSEWPHLLASLALQRLGRDELAARAAREAVRLAPHAWQTQVQLARASVRVGRLNEARSGSDAALALGPEEAEVHITAGAVAAAAGHPDEAEDHFRRALAIDPDNAAAHNELARLQLRYGRPTDPAGLARAAKGFATAVRSDPRAAVSRRNLDLVLRSFLGRVAYGVFIFAFGLLRLRAIASLAVSRVALLFLLSLLGIFVGVFVGRPTNDLRRYLVRVLLGRRIRLAVGLETLAVGCMLASTAVAAATTRTGLAIAAMAAAGGARAWLPREHGQRSWPTPDSRDQSERAGAGLEDLSAWEAMGSHGQRSRGGSRRSGRRRDERRS